MIKAMARGLLAGSFLGLLAGGRAAAAEWPDLSIPSPEQGGGQNDVAVVVGADRYPFVPRVSGAARNADDWHLYLTKVRKVPVGRVRLLRDIEATLEQLREEAAWAAKTAKPGGTLWWIFIGHGAASKDGKEGMLVGIDAQPRVESLYARSLGQAELMRALSQGAQARSVVVLDTCFSGRTAAGSELVKGLQPLVVHIGADRSWPRAAVFTAGAADQFAGPLPGTDRPAFSYLLLGALRGWADADKDGSVTPSEAIGYVQEALQALLKDRRQVPGLQSEMLGTLASGAREGGPDIGAFVRAAAAQPAEAPAPAKPQTASLDVRVEGVRGAKGEVGAALYNAKTGYPVHLEHAYESEWAAPQGQDAVSFLFDSLAPGDYAVSVVHDTNGNRQVDRGMVGFPKEGVAFSQDCKVTLRAPRFDECKFSLQAGQKMRITVPLVYPKESRSE